MTKWKTIIACVTNARCSQNIMNGSTCKGKWGALNDDFNKNFDYMARIGKSNKILKFEKRKIKIAFILAIWPWDVQQGANPSLITNHLIKIQGNVNPI